VSGADLFGNSSWGQQFEDGYRAMETLDSNTDGVLEGDELSTIYLWVDSNLDALAGDGEVRPARDVFKSLSVSPSRDGKNAFCESGAILADGRNVSTWDWWSSRGAAVGTEGRQGRVSYPILAPVSAPILDCSKVQQPLIYRWEHPKLGVRGYLRFFQAFEEWYVATIGPGFDESRVAGIGPVVGTKDGVLEWVLSSSHGAVKVRVTVDPQGNLTGDASYEGGVTGKLEAAPLVAPFPFDPVAFSFFSLPDSVFTAAVELDPNRATGAVIPVGVFQPCFGEKRELVSEILGW
jgi:hypothetical protein